MTTEKSTIVYQYILKRPIAAEAHVRAEMEQARRYRNVLTEIARGERQAKRNALLAVSTFAMTFEAAHAACARVALAHETARRQHGDARARDHTDEVGAELTAARAGYADALRALSLEQRRVERLDDVKSEFARIASLAGELRRSARAHQAPWWGTYSYVEADMDRALRRVLGPGKSIALPLWDGVEPCDPRFVRRADYTDFVACYVNQATRPRTSEFIRIEPPQLRENAFPGGGRAGNPERPRKVLALRVGMGDDGPIFARWPIQPDRDIPEDADITGCKVTCTREGRAERWVAHVTLRTNERPRGAPLGTGLVAVDVGWRRMPDGSIRVAYWRGHDGAGGEIRLSDRDVTALTKADSLRSIRDRWFNETRAEFRKWLNTNIVADWLRAATATLEDWRQPGRLARLTMDWRTNDELRFDGDWPAVMALETWRRQDAHLWHWECAQRNQALARRKDRYRCAAAKLARQYGVLILEAFDLRGPLSRPDVLADGELNTRATARLVAVGELRQGLEQAFVRRGGTVRRVDPADTTHICPACGVVTEFDAARRIDWVCSGCHVRWDQDESAAEVLLIRGQHERFGDASAAGTARQNDVAAKPQEKRESKWARIKRQKAERAALDGGARIPDGNPMEGE